MLPLLSLLYCDAIYYLAYDSFHSIYTLLITIIFLSLGYWKSWQFLQGLPTWQHIALLLRVTLPIQLLRVGFQIGSHPTNPPISWGAKLHFVWYYLSPFHHRFNTTLRLTWDSNPALYCSSTITIRSSYEPFEFFKSCRFTPFPTFQYILSRNEDGLYLIQHFSFISYTGIYNTNSI